MRFLILILTLLVASVEARIRETRDFSIVFDELEQGTLLVLDIDNTLLLPNQCLGCTKWGWKYVDRLKEQGMSKSEARIMSSRLMKHILRQSGCHAVDYRIPEIIGRAQDWGIHVVGITNRPPELGFLTADQLQSCGINLMRTTPVQEDFRLFGQADTQHLEGVIHVGEMEDKGEALANFLRMSHLHPRRILFVDDSERSIRDARTAIERLDASIQFVGVWYREAEGWCDSYNQKIADVQLDAFDRLLTNEEANKLLQAGIIS